MSMVNKLFTIATALLATAFAVAHDNPPQVRPRVSDLGLKVGILPSGPLDAITDVAGVEVGSDGLYAGR
jgi:D-aminopeptidase